MGTRSFHGHDSRSQAVVSAPARFPFFAALRLCASPFSVIRGHALPFGALLVALAGLVSAAAAQPREDAPEPERLHQVAEAAFYEGRIDEAIGLWLAAERLAPGVSKYPANVCLAWELRHRPRAAWRACRRAIAIAPPERTARLTEILRRLEAALLHEQAWIELEVAPVHARVWLDGAPWAAPRGAWSRSPASTLRVSAPGFTTVERRWEHPAGQRHRLELALAPLAAELSVEGTPAGARVVLDGRPIGALGELAAQSIEPGPHELAVFDGEVELARWSLQLAPGETRTVRLGFEAAPSAPVIVATPSGFGPWPWVSITAGALLAAAGVALVVDAAAVRDEISPLNDLRPRPADYQARFDSLAGRARTEWGLGWASGGVGVALLSLGLALALSAPGPEGHVSPGVDE